MDRYLKRGSREKQSERQWLECKRQERTNAAGNNKEETEDGSE